MSTVPPNPNEFDLARLAASDSVALLQFHETLPSTQDLAEKLARRSDLKLPALVLTNRQTAGRGRRANPWWSSAGSLTFSLVVQSPDLSDAAGSIFSQALSDAAGSASRASLAAALAVCEVVAELAPEARCGIKWPNDVYLAGRKIGGVLLGVPARRGDRPRRAVIGVGLNVNNPVRDAPPDIAAVAVSLLEVTGRRHDLTGVLLAVLARLDAEPDALARPDPNQAARWQARSLLDGRRVTVQQGSIRTTGLCLGLADDGALLIRTAAGDERCVGGVVVETSPPLTPEH